MFYDRLKQLCAEQGTTVTALLKSLGISTGNTGAWRKGKLPSIEMLQQFATHFKVSVDYLLGNTEVRRAADQAGDVTFDDFTYAMYGESKALTEADKKMLLDMARMLRERQHREGKDKQ